MSMIKEILKKLLIAGLTGAIILAFVYVKDNYLSQGDQDSEILNEVTFTKGVAPKENALPNTQHSNDLVIEVQNVEETPILKENEHTNIVANKQDVKEIIPEKKVKKELSFEEYKKSMSFNGSADAAFDELERETNQ